MIQAYESMRKARFNRYMVECECLQYQQRWKVNPVLIDTWWNVNDSGLIQADAEYSVLIDTWWNVNRGCKTVSASEIKF